MKDDRYYREIEKTAILEKNRCCEQLETASRRLLNSSAAADRLTALVGAAYGTIEGYLKDHQPRDLSDPAYREPTEAYEASKVTEAFGGEYQKREFRISKRPGETWHVSILGNYWFWRPSDETASKLRRRLEDKVRKDGWQAIRTAAASLGMEV